MSTRTKPIRIKTNRGFLTIHPDGTLDGLWRLAARELRTAAQVRELAGGISRGTLIRWRTADFPAPVMKIKAQGGTVELWSRTQVESWLAPRDQRM